MSNRKLTRKGGDFIKALGPWAPRLFTNMVNNSQKNHILSEQTQANVALINYIAKKTMTNQKKLYQDLLNALVRSQIINESNSHNQIIKKINNINKNNKSKKIKRAASRSPSSVSRVSLTPIHRPTTPTPQVRNPLDFRPLKLGPIRPAWP